MSTVPSPGNACMLENGKDCCYRQKQSVFNQEGLFYWVEIVDDGMDKLAFEHTPHTNIFRPNREK